MSEPIEELTENELTLLKSPISELISRGLLQEGLKAHAKRSAINAAENVIYRQKQEAAKSKKKAA